MKVKKNLKGASVVGVLIVLVLIAAAVVVAYMLLNGKFGLGKGQASADKGSETVSASQDETPDDDEIAEKEAEPAAAESVTLQVTVKGDKYSYDGGEFDLDARIAAIQKENNPSVEIYDDGGLAEKLDELTVALTENGIPYVDKTAE